MFKLTRWSFSMYWTYFWCWICMSLVIRSVWSMNSSICRHSTSIKDASRSFNLLGLHLK